MLKSVICPSSLLRKYGCWLAFGFVLSVFNRNLIESVISSNEDMTHNFGILKK